MNNILKISGKIIIALSIALLQLLWTITLINNMNKIITIIYIISIILSFITILYINYQRIIPETKLFWTIIILLIPIFGILFYIITHTSKSFFNLEKKIQKEEEKFKKNQNNNPTIIEEVLLNLFSPLL